MKNTVIIILLLAGGITLTALPDGAEILKKIDDNMFAGSVYMKSSMIVHGTRGTREMVSESWTRGSEDAFSEYLAPPRETGTRMLKLGDNLWIYNPGSDRIITISGNMMRQSVMGSDLSYEDYMEETKLSVLYTAEVQDTLTWENRPCWKVQLTAKKEDIAYTSRMMYVDRERYLPLYTELYGKSGKLLKKMEIHDVLHEQNRWYPKRAMWKDMLKSGDGTEWVIQEIIFDVDIPPAKLSKAALRG